MNAVLHLFFSPRGNIGVVKFWLGSITLSVLFLFFPSPGEISELTSLGGRLLLILLIFYLYSCVVLIVKRNADRRYTWLFLLLLFVPLINICL